MSLIHQKRHRGLKMFASMAGHVAVMYGGDDGLIVSFGSTDCFIRTDYSLYVQTNPIVSFEYRP